MVPDTANPEGLARCGSFGKSATAFVGADAFADSADSLVGAGVFSEEFADCSFCASSAGCRSSCSWGNHFFFKQKTAYEMRGASASGVVPSGMVVSSAVVGSGMSSDSTDISLDVNGNVASSGAG